MWTGKCLSVHESPILSYVCLAGRQTGWAKGVSLGFVGELALQKGRKSAWVLQLAAGPPECSDTSARLGQTYLLMPMDNPIGEYKAFPTRVRVGKRCATLEPRAMLPKPGSQYLVGYTICLAPVTRGEGGGPGVVRITGLM